ncbi:MAG: TrkH family potassium uptake protein [Eubacteriales bacterium]|nr:TrkH family potassium uptake protein [Eubacteriales bacterium]MDD3882068.1 TrkH family potassium uptake protein [Eubacteriales bacterium]MDD4512515.1 TrkH family potassium uptake protein [Eubacteriales bacterium]
MANKSMTDGKRALSNQGRKRGLAPTRMIVLGFFVIVMLGTALLSLPAASRSGKSVGFFDALFTATSATCVTGLTTLETGSTFTLFGQIVLLCLIELGGLGFMIFATMVFLMIGKRISLRERLLMRESMNADGLSGLIRLSVRYVLLAVVIEVIGAALLMTRFVPLYGWGTGIYRAVFHSVSAFCNAGFDVLGAGNSIMSFSGDPVVLLTFAALVIMGGLGFVVLVELLEKRKASKPLSPHARLVLLSTAALIVFGSVVFCLLEWNNPKTLANGELSPAMRVINSFFQSVTLRTAGFDSIGQAGLTQGSKLISSVLMFIGASPASTGGGIKTTTAAVILFLLITDIHAREDVAFGKRRIPRDIVSRALAIFFISFFFLIASSVVMTVLEGAGGADSFQFIDLLFETASALGTTGLSSQGTATLTRASQSLLIFLMFIGRVGPLTMTYALFNKYDGRQTPDIHYPDARILVG